MAITNAPALISKAPASPWKVAYRIFKWITLAGAVLSLLLIIHKVSPPEVASDPRATERLEAKLHDAEMATASGQPYLLKITEAELNSFLGTHLELKPSATSSAPAHPPATRPAPAQSPSAPGSAESNATVEEVQSSVRDVRINLVEDCVHAYVVFDFHGKDLSLQLEGRLHAEDGYLKFDPVSGALGAFPLPQSSLESAVHKMMDSPENREKMRLPPEISDLHIANGEVVVSYK
jgi:hypothetical protein